MVGLAASAALASCTDLPRGTSAVARVPDAATVILADGTVVRLHGILAPDAADADADAALWLPEAEARRALEVLVAGRSVGLFSPRARDRHGRQPAQLAIVDGERTLWVQEELVAGGHARVSGGLDDATCTERLLAAERAARSADRGLWRNAAYQPVQAEPPGPALARADSFQIVIGRVLQAFDVRGTTYLNFGADWRRDFTAVVLPKVRQLLAARGIDVRTLTGHHVEVRGWIERRNGPQIVVRGADDLVVVAEPEATSKR
jgi:micrococcal nuclease